jgi:hypothetical protein
LDVEFPTREESSVEPPNPDYLKVHAAFARVLNLCGAVDYITRVELKAKEEGALDSDGFASFLVSNFTGSTLSAERRSQLGHVFV